MQLEDGGDGCDGAGDVVTGGVEAVFVGGVGDDVLSALGVHVGVLSVLGNDVVLLVVGGLEVSLLAHATSG